jgi:hypothetical protein
MKRKLTMAGDLVPVEVIERRIYLIRGQKVMIDSDLAESYQVPTKSLNLAVRRNAVRFPGDFMFELSQETPATGGFPQTSHRLLVQVRPPRAPTAPNLL